MMKIDLTHSKILIVDDQEANVRILESLLEIKGFKHVKSTTDSRQVEELVKSFSPDILLLDLMMPHMSGFEVMEQLREKEKGSHFMPILMLTADSTKESKQQALQLGATDFLTKPFDFTEVLLRINNLLMISHLMGSLKGQNELLEEKVKERTVELEQKNEELEQFVFIASHDLQEPLRMITEFLGQLKLKYGDSIDERGMKYIDFAVKSALKMKGLIVDLLEYSKADALVLGDSPKVDLNDVLDDVRILLNNIIETTKAEINIGSMPQIKAPISVLRQIFQNLIGNALRYRHEDISPVVNIRATEDETCYIIEVEDNGIGIASESQGRIFDLFHRIHTPTDQVGSGVGLPITKKIIERMNGTLEVKSELGKGSIFTIQLPK
jgi:two-component system sensor histidine kinase/response regulator